MYLQRTTLLTRSSSRGACSHTSDSPNGNPSAAPTARPNKQGFQLFVGGLSSKGYELSVGSRSALRQSRSLTAQPVRVIPVPAIFVLVRKRNVLEISPIEICKGDSSSSAIVGCRW
ncbi:hypothetical protein MBLNU459_g0614t1 [Dothideomycetes sp. NU459]